MDMFLLPDSAQDRTLLSCQARPVNGSERPVGLVNWDFVISAFINPGELAMEIVACDNQVFRNQLRSFGRSISLSGEKS